MNIPDNYVLLRQVRVVEVCVIKDTNKIIDLPTTHVKYGVVRLLTKDEHDTSRAKNPNFDLFWEKVI